MTRALELDGRPLDAVLLDIDDTLVDTRAAFAAALDAVRQAYLPHVSPDRLPELLATWRADVGGHYRAYVSGEQTIDEQRLHRADELHRAFGGAPVDAETYGEWAGVYGEAFESSWRAADDARALVDHLVSAGVAIGAVSNAGRELQELKLEATGFADVPVLVAVDTMGFGKPDPRVFLEACRLIDVEPARTAYVGDELDTDAIAATNAGLVGVWLDRPGSARGGDHLEDPVAAERAGVLRVADLDVLRSRLVARAPAGEAERLQL